MDDMNLSRLSEYLKSYGYSAALLSNPANITWLTGYASPIQTGPSPFEGGPALGWFRDGELTLILNDWESYSAIELGVNVHPYTGYTIDAPLAGISRQSQSLREVLLEHASLKGAVAVEMDFLPAALYESLPESLPGARFEHFEDRLTPLRAVKSSQEIEKLRRAIRLSDFAQEELLRNLKIGISELDLWAAVKRRVEKEEGGRVPVLADLVAAERTSQVGGLPGTYTLKPGDTVMLDFVSRHQGYWGDNCAGYFVGDPEPKLVKAARVVLDALLRGQDAIRPGLKAGDLDHLVRSVISEAGYEPFPHHAGHGLGTTFHEEPRIVPNHTIILEKDMVLALEPGIYLPGIGGIRFENAYLVTSDGCELLTHHLENYPMK
jgi:Xaa-Pro aminopeptidase